MTDCLKAHPAEEGGKRFVYLEASNETTDQQNESILAKALEDSADYYLRFGNLDLDHITQLGPKRGITDYAAFEIGRPVQVRVAGRETFVKGEVFQGDTPVAANANMFWDSLTRTRPPHRWYPSVGGAVMDRGNELDPATRRTRTVIRKVRWTNIGFSKTPVNDAVPAVSTVPFGVLAKCWGVGGLDIAKAMEGAAAAGLTAGYGTDSATLSGGAALRAQSLDQGIQSYWEFRDRMAAAIRRKEVRPSIKAMVGHTTGAFGVNPHTAAEWVERFLADLKRGRQQQGKSK